MSTPVLPAARASDRRFATTRTVAMLGHSFWARGVFGGMFEAAIAVRRAADPTGVTWPNYYNGGVSGNTIAQMAARAATVVAASLPAIVIVAGCENDTGTNPTTLAANYDSLVAACVAGGVAASNIWLCNTCGLNSAYPNPGESTYAALNVITAAAAARNGCQLLDVHAQYIAYRAAGGTNITPDNVHPSVGDLVSPINGDKVYAGFMANCVSLT